MLKLLKYKNSEYFFASGLFILFVLNILLLWPGTLTPDSIVQYNSALTGVYGDHHPAIMSFVWRYLDRVYSGSGLMLILNLAMLYGAAFFFQRSVIQPGLKLFFIFFPLLPWIIYLSYFIWKDVAFAFAYLFCFSLLSYYYIHDKRFTKLHAISFIIILLYGTMVKFHGQYLAPIPLAWFVWHNFSKKTIIKQISVYVALLVSFYTGMFYINNTLVPDTNKNYSWQMVKLYDLAAISIATDQILIPEQNRTKYFSREALIHKFSPKQVDDLLFNDDDAILKLGNNDHQRYVLWKTWAIECLKHPVPYLTHRIRNLCYVIFDILGFNRIQEKILEISGGNIFLYKGFIFIARIGGYLFLAPILPLICGVFYFFISLMHFRKSKYASPVVYMTGTAIGMMMMLFIFSMAGTSRYSYISICLIHACHPFMWLLWKDIKNTNLKTN